MFLIILNTQIVSQNSLTRQRQDHTQQILALEKKYRYLKNKNSPSQKVGYKPSGKFKKIEHDIPMLSLANAFSKENIKDFLKKIKNFLNIKDSEKIVFSAEPKIDGISASLLVKIAPSKVVCL